MPATIRLKRVGRKKQPSYRIVVIEKSAAVDGPPIENLGIYQPRTEPSVIRLDAEKALRWLRDGAEPSDTVRSLLRRAGLWEKFHAGVTPEELTEKEIYLGPEGAWKTSGRAAAAAEAREAARAAEAEAAEAEAAEAAEVEAAEAEAEADDAAGEPEEAEEPAAEGEAEEPVAEAAEEAAEEAEDEEAAEEEPKAEAPDDADTFGEEDGDDEDAGEPKAEADASGEEDEDEEDEEEA